MVRRERKREEFDRFGKAQSSGSRGTRLHRIAFDQTGTLRLQIGGLVGKRSAHLNANAIEEWTSLPGIVERAEFNLLPRLEVADLKWTASDPLSVVAR